MLFYIFGEHTRSSFLDFGAVEKTIMNLGKTPTQAEYFTAFRYYILILEIVLELFDARRRFINFSVALIMPLLQLRTMTW